MKIKKSQREPAKESGLSFLMHKFVKNTRILKRIFPRKDGKTIGRRKGKTRIRQDSQNESKKLVEMEIV